MLKAVDLESKIPVVWPRDPAVDQEASDIEGYREHAVKGNWKDYLKLKENCKPTIFWLGVVPAPELVAIEACTEISAERFWRCFLHAIRDIENADELAPMVTDEHGRSKRELPRKNVDSISFVSPIWLSRTFAKHLRGCAIFLGSVAYTWNLFMDDDAKN